MVKKLRVVPLVYKQYTKFNDFYPPPEPSTSNELLREVLKSLMGLKEEHVERVRNPLLESVEADYKHVKDISDGGGYSILEKKKSFKTMGRPKGSKNKPKIYASPLRGKEDIIE